MRLQNCHQCTENLLIQRLALSKASALKFWPPAGLCLHALRQFLVSSAAPLPWPSAFSWAAPFFKAGRSLLAFGSNSAVKRTASPPLTLAVSTEENQFISPMFIQTAFNFSGVVQRWVCRFSGLRLLALRRFPAFLASSHFLVSASSYCFRSPLLVRSHSFLRFGSNPALKPTRILRAAYLVR